MYRFPERLACACGRPCLRPYLFLLESVEGGEVWPPYSFLGVDPLIVLTAKSGRLTLRSLSIGNETAGS